MTGPISGDEGQSTVELALALPMVALLALGLIQIGLIVHQQVLVTHIAREGARAAAVDESPDAAREAVVAGAPLDPERVVVEVLGRGETGSRVTVTVTYDAPMVIPLVGTLMDDVSLTAAATMRVE